MKNLYFLLFLILISCGISEEEARLREKSIRDSIALSEANKKLMDRETTNNNSTQAANQTTQERTVPAYSQTEKTSDVISTDQLKHNLKNEESSNPLSYLYIKDNVSKPNLIGEEVITGWVCNKATLANFKDVTLKVIYYSKTGRQLSTKWLHVDEFIKHGKCVYFKKKVGGDKSAKTWNISIHSANAY